MRLEKGSGLDLTENRVQMPSFGHPSWNLEMGRKEWEKGAREGHHGNWQPQLDILLNLPTKGLIAFYETTHSCHIS